MIMELVKSVPMRRKKRKKSTRVGMSENLCFKIIEFITEVFSLMD
jgi:hypothetical protein